jgi:hypothetical protein
MQNECLISKEANCGEVLNQSQMLQMLFCFCTSLMIQGNTKLIMHQNSQQLRPKQINIQPANVEPGEADHTIPRTRQHLAIESPT